MPFILCAAWTASTVLATLGRLILATGCSSPRLEISLLSSSLFPEFQAARELKIPFVASGGCADGKQLAAALALGAEVGA